MVLKMRSVFLIVAATIYTGSCQCPVGAVLKYCDAGERPCPIGYYCLDLMMSNPGYCCRQVCWHGAPITGDNGKEIECGKGRKGICPATATCTRTGRYGARSVCCHIRMTIG